MAGGKAEQEEERIADLAGFIQVACAKREAEALLAIFREVQGEMAPPCAMVVPEMVVGIARCAAEGEFGFGIHGAVVAGAPGAEMTKPSR